EPLQLDQLELRQLTAHSTRELLNSITSLTEPFGLDHLMVHYETLEPGRRTSHPHVHSHKQKIIIVLTGHPTILLSDQRISLKPHTVLGFRPASGKPHTIVNE